MALPGQKASPPGATVRKLRKGEVLFHEGETSRAMYYLKAGMIRIFKAKGDSAIEIDTVHSGQVLGELAFLDGNPRSASGEALTDCELVEISGEAFQHTLGSMPEWLKILLKAVVGRLRTASTRIRQLETASTAYDYSDKDAKKHYVYLSPSDAMKVCTGLILVGARNGKAGPGGTQVRISLLQRYVNQVMGVPVAKITTFLDTLGQLDVVTIQEAGGDTQVLVKDLDYLEKLVAYMNEENLLEPSKRHDLTPKGFLIMSLIAKHLPKFSGSIDAKTGMTQVNVAEIQKGEAAVHGAKAKALFGTEDFQELVKLGYATNLTIKSASESFTLVKADAFVQAYKLQRAVMSIRAVNEQKKAKPAPKAA